MQDSVEEPYFNPFAADGPSEYSQSSLDGHIHSNQPPRDSSLSFTAASSSSGAQISGSGNYVRARKEVGTASTSGQHHHPLRSASLSYGHGDAGITRPHLNRALDTGILVDVPSAVEDEDDGLSKEEGLDEKTVLVHEVSSKDSLAGVAVKYGISLTELRRANHLWFSDSIHLRKVLYIPLDKASRSEELMTGSVKSSMSSTPGADNSVLPSTSIQKSSIEDVDRTKNSTADVSSAPTIRRVPASTLSFFPPPSRPPVMDTSSSQPIPPKSVNVPKPHHVRSATSPPPSLNSILTALPIAASTRDTIIARLSFDSPGSSYSDREREWQRGDFEGHELDDVRAHRQSHYASEDGSQNSFPGVTPRGRAIYDNSSRNHAEEYTGPSPTEESFSLARVRNIQLEPSPVMQLPDVSSMRNKFDARGGKARPRLIDVDFGSTDSLSSTQQVDG